MKFQVLVIMLDAYTEWVLWYYFDVLCDNTQLHALLPTNSLQERTSEGILPSSYFLNPPCGIFF